MMPNMIKPIVPNIIPELMIINKKFKEKIKLNFWLNKIDEIYILLIRKYIDHHI